MKAITRLASLALFILLVGCSERSLEMNLYKSHALHGEDESIEILSNNEDIVPNKITDAVAMIIDKGNVEIYENYAIVKPSQKLENLDWSEKLKNKYDYGYCTSFKTASNLITTASHCVSSGDNKKEIKKDAKDFCEENYFIFGFNSRNIEVLEDGKAKVSLARVQECDEVLFINEASNEDFAIIQASNLGGIPDLKFSATIPEIGDRIYKVGHSYGTIQRFSEGKVSVPATDNSRKTEGRPLLATNLDTLAGDSGSPVLNSDNEVVGIHINVSAYSYSQKLKLHKEDGSVVEFFPKLNDQRGHNNLLRTDVLVRPIHRSLENSNFFESYSSENLMNVLRMGTPSDFSVLYSLDVAINYLSIIYRNDSFNARQFIQRLDGKTLERVYLDLLWLGDIDSIINFETEFLNFEELSVSKKVYAISSGLNEEVEKHLLSRLTTFEKLQLFWYSQEFKIYTAFERILANDHELANYSTISRKALKEKVYNTIFNIGQFGLVKDGLFKTTALSNIELKIYFKVVHADIISEDENGILFSREVFSPKKLRLKYKSKEGIRKVVYKSEKDIVRALFSWGVDLKYTPSPSIFETIVSTEAFIVDISDSIFTDLSF
ncbi:MAG: trypsin-like serine peptidase [Bacteriovoracaceae bacterium]